MELSVQCLWIIEPEIMKWCRTEAYWILWSGLREHATANTTSYLLAKNLVHEYLTRTDLKHLLQITYNMTSCLNTTK